MSETEPAASPRTSRMVLLAVVAVVLAAGFAGLSWLDARHRIDESQSQSLALEALYQDLSRNRDEWQLAEIEQVLAIASQQLQLARNVRAALLALQLADSRLARTDR